MRRSCWRGCSPTTKGLTENQFFETRWINVSQFSQFSHVTLYPPMPKNDLQAKPSCPQRVLAPCFNLWGHTAADHWCGEDIFVLFLCSTFDWDWEVDKICFCLYLQQTKLCKFLVYSINQSINMDICFRMKKISFWSLVSGWTLWVLTTF